ncbi:MAG: hypothetical protein IPM08_01255 [Actinomycetales bacterium]|nr:hypothetical protein [Actinomycetales bacterium]
MDFTPDDDSQLAHALATQGSLTLGSLTPGSATPGSLQLLPVVAADSCCGSTGGCC